MEELNSLSLMDLKELAKMKGISNYSKLKKSELIDAILEISNQKSNVEEDNNIEVEKEDNNDTRSNNNSNDENKYGEGILEILPDGFGFLRGDNYLPTQNDIYVSPSQIRGLRLRTGDIITGIAKEKTEKEKFQPLIQIDAINGYTVKESLGRHQF